MSRSSTRRSLCLHTPSPSRIAPTICCISPSTSRNAYAYSPYVGDLRCSRPVARGRLQRLDTSGVIRALKPRLGHYTHPKGRTLPSSVFLPPSRVELVVSLLGPSAS